jgi:signal transduction histidine kinase
MAKNKDPMNPDVSGEDLEALQQIARQIDAEGAIQTNGKSGKHSINGAGKGAKDKDEPSPSPSSADGGEKPDFASYATPEHGSDPVLDQHMVRGLADAASGFAICSGDDLIDANASFAFAFGYQNFDELKNSGGLGAIFPKKASQLTDALGPGGEILERRKNYNAVTRSGRKVEIPIAIHDLGKEGELPVRLLVLHPESANEETEAILLRFRAQDQHSAEKNEPAAAKTLKQQVDPPRKHKPVKRVKANKRPVIMRKKSSTKKKRKPGPDIEFLAKVSHEIRTPLNSIIGFADLMKEEQLGPIGNDRYKTYVRDIHDSGQYALSLVNDLLEISKIQAGKLELNFTAVDVNEVISECVHMMQPQAQTARVILRVSLAEDTPRVLADQRSLKQILLNLISNAVKFTRPGGQVIIASRCKSGGAVRIRVRDSGIGMTKGEIALAMEPFRQVDTAPRQQHGTGLGLPLTKSLVKANKARFKLKSSPDVGTRIDIVFPAARAVRD